MTGYVMAVAGCFSCGHPFTFNPHKVPSIRVNGEREPICSYCMQRANALRVAKGEPPHPIDPDAYAALPEQEL